MDGTTVTRLHYTELHILGWERLDGPEWLTYCREVGRLLAKGREGQYIWIAGDSVVAYSETLIDSYNEWMRRTMAGEPAAKLYHIQEWMRLGRLAPRMRLTHREEQPSGPS
jgi:hypothetical protein